MDKEYEAVKKTLIEIASELFRFNLVFNRVLGKLDLEDQAKYQSQYAWFTKKVYKALEDADLKIVDLSGKPYDPGMAVTPLNLEDFDTEDVLYIEQMIEPVIMENDSIIKVGTAILGRIEK